MGKTLSSKEAYEYIDTILKKYTKHCDIHISTDIKQIIITVSFHDKICITDVYKIIHSVDVDLPVEYTYYCDADDVCSCLKIKIVK